MRAGVPRTAVSWIGRSSIFVAWTVLSFILLSALLVWVYRVRGAADIQWQIRAGILRDVVSELPIGRQALVSSLWVMPLPTILALPFVPPLRLENYGLAYIYGIALSLAVATVPLACLLRRARVPLSKPLSVTLLAAGAYALGATRYSDMLVCLSCLIAAVLFDTHRRAGARALAGTFYGLALLAHLLGLAVAGARLCAMAADRFLAHPDRQRRAVQWIQGAGIAYAFVVYLFLNWMIMRAPLWSLRHFAFREPEFCGMRAARELAAVLAARYPSSAPVVSGHWGYAVEPVIRAAQGHHFIDFHRDKVPLWERRELVLVVPTEANPLLGLSDIASVLHRSPARVAGYLLLSETPYWEFYLVVKPEMRASLRDVTRGLRGSRSVPSLLFNEVACDGNALLDGPWRYLVASSHDQAAAAGSEPQPIKYGAAECRLARLRQPQVGRDAP